MLGRLSFCLFMPYRFVHKVAFVTIFCPPYTSFSFWFYMLASFAGNDARDPSRKISDHVIIKSSHCGGGSIGFAGPSL